MRIPNYSRTNPVGLSPGAGAVNACVWANGFLIACLIYKYLGQSGICEISTNKFAQLRLENMGELKLSSWLGW